MNLYNPLEDSILLLILVMFTIVAYLFMTYLRGKRGIYFGNLKTLQRTHSFRIFHVSSWILLVKIIVIVLLYMVATNSIEIIEFQPISDTDYVLLVDVSSSMAKTDFEPNRLASALEISNQWLNVLPETVLVGEVAFSQNIDSFHPLTLDRNILRTKINELSIDYSKSGTDLDYAVNYAIDLFNSSDHNKTILLLTDGTESVSNLTMVKLKYDGIKVFSFGIGDDEEVVDLSDIPEDLRDTFSSLELNFTVLQDLSERTGGSAYKVSDKYELETSFKAATREHVKVSLNSSYYVALLIAIISILELIIYAKFGAL